MKVYVVVECFVGGKIPEIKGFYRARTKAEEIKNNCRFAFVDEQNLIQVQTEKMQAEVYVVYELLIANVPRIIGVFKDENLAKEVAKDCKYVSNILRLCFLILDWQILLSLYTIGAFISRLIGKSFPNHATIAWFFLYQKTPELLCFCINAQVF